MSPPPERGNAADRQDLQRDEVSKQRSPRRQPLTVASAIEFYRKNRSKKNKPYREPDPTQSYVWEHGWCVTLCDTKGEMITWIIRVRSLCEILFDSAPPQGQGLHFWLITGAKICHEHGETPEQAYDFIAATVVARGGVEKPNDIRKAIDKVYGGKLSGSYRSKPKWPEPDLKQIEQVTLERLSKDGESPLEELLRLSPERPSDAPEETDRIVRQLFPADGLICVGMNKWSTTTFALSGLERLHRFQFLVANPMSALTGINQDGIESGRCLDNTGPRRFVVVEFDFKKHDDQGQLTKWAPLIDQWESRGATIQDAAASIILHMAQVRPLTMVVYSGKKSLHAWWYCADEPEHEDSRLRNFMADAVRLGADPATYTRSQFVRMPGAIRPDTGRKQLVYFLDFKHVEGVNR
jgi:hypothetical protein